MTESVRPDGVPENFERCRECKNWLPLDEYGYIVNHSTVYAEGKYLVQPMHDLTNTLRYSMVGTPCNGRLKRSLEWKERAFQKKWSKHDATVQAIAMDADVAFDAWSAGRPIATDYYIGLALDEYKKRYGASSISKTRIIVSARCAGGDWRNHKMDVYCTLCRGLLLARISTAANPLAFPKVSQHAIQCALLCLSGRQEYMPPEHRGLIIDDRAFAD